MHLNDFEEIFDRLVEITRLFTIKSQLAISDFLNRFINIFPM